MFAMHRNDDLAALTSFFLHMIRYQAGLAWPDTVIFAVAVDPQHPTPIFAEIWLMMRITALLVARNGSWNENRNICPLFRRRSPDTCHWRVGRAGGAAFTPCDPVPAAYALSGRESLTSSGLMTLENCSDTSLDRGFDPIRARGAPSGRSTACPFSASASRFDAADVAAKGGRHDHAFLARAPVLRWRGDTGFRAPSCWLNTWYLSQISALTPSCRHFSRNRSGIKGLRPRWRGNGPDL